MDLSKGKLKVGLIMAPPGEKIEANVLNFALYLTGFPKAEKIALATGKRTLGGKKLLAELISSRGTVGVETSRVFGKCKGYQCSVPGEDGILRNGILISWLVRRVREEIRAPSDKSTRYLVFLHTLPALLPGRTVDDINLLESHFSLGRIIEQYSDFIAVRRCGRIDFLKHRTGDVFPEGSWQI